VVPLLGALAREGVRATFALVGERANEHPELGRAIVDAGNEVANHSQGHSHPRDLDDAALDLEVAAAQVSLTEHTGVAPAWYWPPYLELDERVRTAARRAGVEPYVPMHVVVSRDYDNDVPADEIVRLATTGVKDGSVIVFHEWRAETRERLPEILAELRRQRCRFFTFSALLESLRASDAAAGAGESVPVRGAKPH
jgi:peptidoglycan/xylan/chitin deacetylase (PgdA/CDA1 family)